MAEDPTAVPSEAEEKKDDSGVEITPYTKDDELWLAWESNPELYNEFAEKLGLDMTKFGFRELWDLSPEVWPALMPDFVPSKVRAVILLFPGSVGAEAKKSPTVDTSARYLAESDDSLFYFYQLDLFGNACGPISVIHALANAHEVSLGDDSLIGKLVGKWRSIDSSKVGERLTLAKGVRKKPTDGEWTAAERKSRALWQERGLRLLTDSGVHVASDSIADSDSAQTDTPKKDDSTNAHFVAFVYRRLQVTTFIGDDAIEETKYCIVELDGRKEFPVVHSIGSGDETREHTTPDSFTSDCISVIKDKFMAAAEGFYGFSVAVLESKE